ncbi:MAG TPA: methylglyoxal synthase [Casimicrobiaceae bacterium]|nr:methylglyoxal synthase [Casimicrobiaceae bacterium]
MTAAPRRIGLAASGLHRDGRDGALARLVRRHERAIRVELHLELFAVGRTHGALRAQGLLDGYAGLHALPERREGGLMRLAAMLVDEDPARALDAIVYLLDPDDPASLFPEGLALKRQCVVHGKPFISTYAHAEEWIELERVLAGWPGDPLLDERFDPARHAIALVAHDARKDAMVAFARRHFALLSRFAKRYATGTTGTRLEALAVELGAPPAWVHKLRSGPLGGDAQLAERVLDRAVSRVIFLEDPHVARQHEADIQLLERAARIATGFAGCVNDPASAERWAEGFSRRARAHAGTVD